MLNFPLVRPCLFIRLVRHALGTNSVTIAIIIACVASFRTLYTSSRAGNSGLDGGEDDRRVYSHTLDEIPLKTNL